MQLFMPEIPRKVFISHTRELDQWPKPNKLRGRSRELRSECNVYIGVIVF